MKIIFKNDDDSLIREITLNEAEEIAFNTGCGTPSELPNDVAGWITHALKNKARKRIDDIVTLSGRGSSFTAVPAKEQIILDLKVEKSDLLKTTAEKIADQVDI